MESKGVITTYRDLIVWQKAMSLVVLIYYLTKEFLQEEIYGLTSQMRRAAVSIPSNIAEGRYRGTKKDFLQFLRISYASGAELETQLEISKRLSFLEDSAYMKAQSLLLEVMKMLHVMIAKFIKN